MTIQMLCYSIAPCHVRIKFVLVVAICQLLEMLNISVYVGLRTSHLSALMAYIIALHSTLLQCGSS